VPGAAIVLLPGVTRHRAEPQHHSGLSPFRIGEDEVNHQGLGACDCAGGVVDAPSGFTDSCAWESHRSHEPRAPRFASRVRLRPVGRLRGRPRRLVGGGLYLAGTPAQPLRLHLRLRRRKRLPRRLLPGGVHQQHRLPRRHPLPPGRAGHGLGMRPGRRAPELPLRQRLPRRVVLHPRRHLPGAVPHGLRLPGHQPLPDLRRGGLRPRLRGAHRGLQRQPPRRLRGRARPLRRPLRPLRRALRRGAPRPRRLRRRGLLGGLRRGLRRLRRRPGQRLRDRPLRARPLRRLRDPLRGRLRPLRGAHDRGPSLLRVRHRLRRAVAPPLRGLLRRPAGRPPPLRRVRARLRGRPQRRGRLQRRGLRRDVPRPGPLRRLRPPAQQRLRGRARPRPGPLRRLRHRLRRRAARPRRLRLRRLRRHAAPTAASATATAPRPTAARPSS
jgi:hypothetical protein